MPLKLLFNLSVRNIFRHRRRNGMLWLAICVAVAFTTVGNGLMRGMQADLRLSAVENLTGDIKILAPGYLDDPGIQRSFELAQSWQPDVPAEELMGWTARVQVPAVIMSERETRGVQLVGVDPAAEGISFFGQMSVDGERLQGADDNRVLIGKALAEKLQTRQGYRLVIITQGADGLNREVGFRVAGVYDAEGTSLEKAYVFTGRQFLQSVLGTTAVTEVSIRFDDQPTVPVGSVVQRLQDTFTGMDVLRWEDLSPTIAAMFQLMDVVLYVLFLIIMMALIFGLANALITAVMERTRELGMLRAVGMRGSAVVMQVVLESTLLMMVGVAVGLGIGILLALSIGTVDLQAISDFTDILGTRNVLTLKVLPGDLLITAAMSLVLGVLASLYPAWRAVKINPLEAMR